MKEKRPFRAITSLPGGRMALCFALEGLLFQFGTSIKYFGNNLFASNLGATDTQIGLIQTIGCGVSLAMLLPAGIVSDRCRSSKTIPVLFLIACGLTYILQAFVPFFGGSRITWYFIFMGLAAGTYSVYSAQWQAMFGDLVPLTDRNRTYALRSRVMAALGVVVPILCGIAMELQTEQSGKLNVLSVFFALAGIAMLVQAVVVIRMPGGRRSEVQLAAIERFDLRNLTDAVREALHSRPFMNFLLLAMLIYTSWQFDWSLYYIAQTRYAGMSEAQISYYNAICCLVQIFSLGFLANVTAKKTAHFTICISTVACTMYPVYAMVTPAVPEAVRSWFFLGINVTASMFECGIMLCLVQMLLEAVPEAHRSLLVSLYTILTTVSNCILPLFGVRLYTWLGADLKAYEITFAIETVWRGAVAVYAILRYRRMKQNGQIRTA